MRIKNAKLPELRNLTNKEMDFFLYLVRRQDLRGSVAGVHNQAVCKATGMCKQSFYSTLYSLRNKGIITYAKNTEIDYDVVITNNDFSYPESFREGYVSIHRQVFHRKSFKKLKANEKYLFFELMKRTREETGSFRIGTKKLYDKFSQLLHVTKRVIRCYLHSLRRFFSIGIKDGLYYITYLHSVFAEREEKGVEEQEFEYYTEVQCRRHHINYSQTELSGTADLIKQYRKMVVETGGTLTMLKELLAKAIEKSVRGLQCKDRKLQHRYVHMLLKNLIMEPTEAQEA